MITENDLKIIIPEITNQFKIPSSYKKIFELGLINVISWYFLETEESKVVTIGLNQNYPYRKVLAFARRKDNDDVACFVIESQKENPGIIIIVHNFASQGFEKIQGKAEFNTFSDWYLNAIKEMIELESLDKNSK